MSQIPTVRLFKFWKQPVIIRQAPDVMYTLCSLPLSKNTRLVMLYIRPSSFGTKLIRTWARWGKMGLKQNWLGHYFLSSKKLCCTQSDQVNKIHGERSLQKHHKFQNTSTLLPIISVGLDLLPNSIYNRFQKTRLLSVWLSNLSVFPNIV